MITVNFVKKMPFFCQIIIIIIIIIIIT